MKLTHRIVVYLGLTAFYLFLLGPMAWLLLCSFRTSDSIQSGHIWPALSELTLYNYLEAFNLNNFPQLVGNSIFIATSVMLLVVLFASLGAYGLSRFP
jgi:ABC-type glycerol-3-phosphate transport system permease component